MLIVAVSSVSAQRRKIEALNNEINSLKEQVELQRIEINILRHAVLDLYDICVELEGKADYEVVEEVVSKELVADASMSDCIVISKESMTLTLYDADGNVVMHCPVAVGRNYGNKQKVGDMRTPEGEFSVSQIQDASAWTHDFKDGKGVIAGCYGNWFIRLKTPPHSGIGIHGTHAPESIGTRATEGCVRLNNADLDKLKPLVRVGMKVTIESSVKDMEADGRAEENGVNKDTFADNASDDDGDEYEVVNPNKLKGGEGGDLSVTKERFAAMGYEERMALKNKNEKLYNSMVK